MNPYPGEIWLADLGLAAKTRLVVIVSRYDSNSTKEDHKEELSQVLVVSRHDPNPPRATITYIPLTTEYRQSPYEVVLPRLRFLNQDSYANVQGLGSIPKTRLERKLGRLPDDVMIEIKNVILFALDLEVEFTKANH